MIEKNTYTLASGVVGAHFAEAKKKKALDAAFVQKHGGKVHMLPSIASLSCQAKNADTWPWERKDLEIKREKAKELKKSKSTHARIVHVQERRAESASTAAAAKQQTMASTPCQRQVQANLRKRLALIKPKLDEAAEVVEAAALPPRTAATRSDAAEAEARATAAAVVVAAEEAVAERASAAAAQEPIARIDTKPRYKPDLKDVPYGITRPKMSLDHKDWRQLIPGLVRN